MAVYTVFEPPLRTRSAGPQGNAAEQVERFVFLRDGFSWGAFLFGPLWLLYRRLWIALVGYVILMSALHIGLIAARVGSDAQLLVNIVVALLLGFEAVTLRRFTLARRGWREIGIVTGDDHEYAERRFFDAWIGERRGAGEETSAVVTTTIGRSFPSSSEVIGLFPAPGGGR